jgi:hypothetical protein
MATTTTDKRPQVVVAPTRRYKETYTWVIDTKTKQPIKVRKEVTLN